MSQRWDIDVGARLDDYESQLDSIYRLYHIPVLAALVAFMVWIRVQFYPRFRRPDGSLMFIGNDAWYHYRTTNYVVQNYPLTMPFDPWTNFDVGTRAGQFGTIFDQLIATAALIIGLGDPSQETIELVFFFAPAVFGALTAIPVYIICRRLGGRFGGIIGVLILALTPGLFLSRSMAGFVDHHVAEALFQATALAVGMVMLTVAQRDRPIYELFESHDFDALRPSLLWAAAFGVLVAVHIWNWPPGVFFVGIFAVFLFVHLSLEFLRGHSPDHVAIPSAVAMGVTALLVVPMVRTTEITATDVSPVQVALPVAVGLGALAMAGVARLWDDRDLQRAGYPAAFVASGLLVAGVVWLVLPDVFEFFVSQFRRVAAFGASDTAQTVGEATAPGTPSQFLYQSYGLAFYSGLAGLALLIYRVAAARRPRAEYVLVIVFTLFMIAATLTQRRFDYYLVIGVAAMNAFLVREIYRFVDLEDVRRDVRNVELYQVLIVLSILFVVAGPLVVTGATVNAASSYSSAGEYDNWAGSLEWLSEETPPPGAYGTGDDPRLEYYGSYDNTDDFEYRDGEYGVLAWWDYGHWITVTGERIPVANPFQQHAIESADFLLADDEQEALDILDEDNGEGAGVQYVMVDMPMGYAGPATYHDGTGFGQAQKYGAPATWEARHGLNDSDVGITVIDPEAQRPLYGVHTQRAYESMRVRLFQFHGSAVDPAPWVVRFGQYSEEHGVATPPEGQIVEPYGSIEEAQEAADQDPNAVHGGLLGAPAERVEALQHFRLVHASEATEPTPLAWATRNPRTGEFTIEEFEPWVKIFERVPGATIQGSGGPPNEEVSAIVRLEVRENETIEYVQYAETDEDGTFEMVVPYATTDYDEYGPDEGYTNTSVRAVTSYDVSTGLMEDEETAELEEYRASFDVTEAQVIGEDDSPVEVELEHEVIEPEGAGDGEDGDDGADGDSEGTQDDEDPPDAETNGTDDADES